MKKSNIVIALLAIFFTILNPSLSGPVMYLGAFIGLFLVFWLIWNISIALFNWIKSKFSKKKH